jgi:UDP-N-acetylmuramoyl-tripeptide--D-alanyl-D-alanine ligase
MNDPIVLWTGADIALATGGILSDDFECGGVSIDTRTLAAGDVYIALKGDALDGHAYVGEAFRRGAVAAIVEKSFMPSVTGAAGGKYVYVEDILAALQDLGMAARTRTTAKIIAVTGSAGKTGTKEMLAVIFGALGKTHASKKSYNNHWGVPLSLACMPLETKFGIFEMGMNHAGELAGLTKLVRPDVAMITTIEPVHLEFFKNTEAIADAKAEVFGSMDEQGIVVLPFDNQHFMRLKALAEKQGVRKIFSFGEDDQADSVLLDCALHADSSKVSATVLGEKVKYKLNISGKHIAMNSLGALTVVKAMAENLNIAIEALRLAVPVAGRGNRLGITIAEDMPPVIIIDESYNANPAAMLAAFEVFAMVEPVAGGRRIAVLGDMLELGKEGPRLHAELANPLLKAKTDLVFCCGLQMDAMYQLLPEDWRGGQAKDSQALALLVTAAVRAGDVILIKGSLGSRMAYVVQALQNMAIAQPKPKDTSYAL